VIVLDVNILVAAAGGEHPDHPACALFLKDCLHQGDVIIPDVVWSGFIRIITNAKAVGQSPSWSSIRAFIAAVQHHPGYRADVRSLTAPLDSFVSLCQAVNARRNLVSDAYIAAIALEHNASVGTFDADFGRLGVPVVHP